MKVRPPQNYMFFTHVLEQDGERGAREWLDTFIQKCSVWKKWYAYVDLTRGTPAADFLTSYLLAEAE